MDWGELHEQAKQHVRRTLRSADPSTVDDLAREVAVRLYRLAQRDPRARPGELLAALAQVVSRDHVRRRMGARGLLSAVADGGAPLELPPPDPAHDAAVDMLELFRFVVLEHFRQHDAASHELAEAFFEEQSWSNVARRLQLPTHKVIRRWSDGAAQVRELAYTQRGPVWEWARAAGIV